VPILHEAGSAAQLPLRFPAGCLSLNRCLEEGWTRRRLSCAMKKGRPVACSRGKRATGLGENCLLVKQKRSTYS
jgi:hypothetical protein